MPGNSLEEKIQRLSLMPVLSKPLKLHINAVFIENKLSSQDSKDFESMMEKRYKYINELIHGEIYLHHANILNIIILIQEKLFDLHQIAEEYRQGTRWPDKSDFSAYISLKELISYYNTKIDKPYYKQCLLSVENYFNNSIISQSSGSFIEKTIKEARNLRATLFLCSFFPEHPEEYGSNIIYFKYEQHPGSNSIQDSIVLIITYAMYSNVKIQPADCILQLNKDSFDELEKISPDKIPPDYLSESTYKVITEAIYQSIGKAKSPINHSLELEEAISKLQKESANSKLKKIREHLLSALEANQQELVTAESILKSNHHKRIGDQHRSYAAGADSPNLKIKQATKNVNQTVSNLILKGLRFQSIPADGHCLFHAVGLYLGQNHTELREEIADYLETHPYEFQEIIQASGISRVAYISRLRETPEWGDALEIEIIQRITNRPIIIIRLDNNPTIPDNLKIYQGDPIFIYYNGHAHYDAFTLEESSNPREILINIQAQLQQGQNLIYNPVTQLDKHSYIASKPSAITSSPDLKHENQLRILKDFAEKNSMLDITCEQLELMLKKTHVYYECIKHWSKDNLKIWVNQIRGKLFEKDSLYELLAIMDRANELHSGESHHRLRDPQLIALYCLLCAGKPEGQGRLMQVATGEGKSTIIAVFAAIQALQGFQIDVITSSSVLAERDVKEKELFYQLFGLSVACNRAYSVYLSGPKPCYDANIVYGDVASFQFDLLYHEYKDLNTLGMRRFDLAIVDEVDSMLIDNGGHIAKISGPLPGMELLLFILFDLWREINARFDFSFLHDKIDKTQKILQLEEDLKKYLRTKVDGEFALQIPEFLRPFVSLQIDVWVKQACHAFFYCHEDRQYIIREEQGELRIIPVDAENTGVLQNNTIWSNGLHQFLQMKHGLRVMPENLTTAFISNVGYFKRYEKNLFGLTGTLGGVAEQKLLRASYNIDFVTVPTFKPKKFEELKPRVAVDRQGWLFEIGCATLQAINQNRAVLLICATIADAQDIQAVLEKLSLNVRSYTEPEQAKMIESDIQPGTVIVATNIAGRGTDIITSREVENNGGLFVGLTFFPNNLRVEKQAFGRTSRQGNLGDAQLILDKTTLAQHWGEIDYMDDPFLMKLKELRENLETKRLTKIESHELPILNFKDKMFREFCQYSCEVRKSYKENLLKYILLDVLEESWGFWLHHQDQLASSECRALLAQFSFNNFIRERNHPDDPTKFSMDKCFNYYYHIQIGNLWHLERDWEEAEKAYKKALDLAQNTSHLAFSANYGLAMIRIHQGKAYEKRLKEGIGYLLPMVFLFKERKDYKNEALAYLKISHESIDKMTMRYKNIMFALPSHYQNKLIALHLKINLQQLALYKFSIEQCENDLAQEGEWGIARQVKCDAKQLSALLNENIDQESAEHQKSFRQQIEITVDELKMLGMNYFCELKRIEQIPKKVLIAAISQISSGLAILAGGCIFPVAFVAASQIAALLISEGVCDLVLELIKSGDEESSDKEYDKGKAISYGIGVLTLGIGEIIRAATMLNRALKFCQMVPSGLKRLKAAWKLSNNAREPISYWIKIAGKTSRIKFASSQLIKSVATDLGWTLFTEQILNKILHQLIQQFESQIRMNVLKELKCHALLNAKIKIIRIEPQKQEIKRLAGELLKEDAIATIIKGIGLGCLKEVKGKFRGLSKLTSHVISIELDLHACAGLVERFADNLLSRFPNFPILEGEFDSDLFLQELAQLLTDYIVGVIENQISQVVVTGLKEGAANFANKDETDIKSIEAKMPSASEAKSHDSDGSLPYPKTRDDLQQTANMYKREILIEGEQSKEIIIPHGHMRKVLASVRPAIKLTETKAPAIGITGHLEAAGGQLSKQGTEPDCVARAVIESLTGKAATPDEIKRFLAKYHMYDQAHQHLRPGIENSDDPELVYGMKDKKKTASTENKKFISPEGLKRKAYEKMDVILGKLVNNNFKLLTPNEMKQQGLVEDPGHPNLYKGTQEHNKGLNVGEEYIFQKGNDTITIRIRYDSDPIKYYHINFECPKLILDRKGYRKEEAIEVLKQKYGIELPSEHDFKLADTAYSSPMGSFFSHNPSHRPYSLPSDSDKLDKANAMAAAVWRNLNGDTIWGSAKQQAEHLQSGFAPHNKM